MRRGDGGEGRAGGEVGGWRWGGETWAGGELGVGAARIWERTQRRRRLGEDLGKEACPL